MTETLSHWQAALSKDAGLALQIVHDVDSRSAERRCHNSVLHLAVGGYMNGAEDEHRQIVQLLLAHGADPNVANDAGKTPLHLACEIETRDALNVEALLAHGANPRLADNHGRTAYDLVARAGYEVELIQASLAKHRKD